MSKLTDKTGMRTERLHFACTVQTRELLERIAITLDMKMSEIVRAAIRELVEKRGIS